MAPLSLPDPPPPAPARREAAIEAALARFDGTTPNVAAPRPKPASPRRPYLVSAMALSLLALMVAPVAWMHRPQRQAEMPQMAHQAERERPRAAAETQHGVALAPPAPVEVRKEPPAAQPSKSAPAPSPLTEAPAAPASAPPPPPVQEKAQALQGMVAPPMAAPAAPPAPALAARAEARRSRMADSANGEDIVVTSARVDATLLRGRGDWNACTVQDPERNPALCRRQIDPGAKGKKGAAAAHMADGLNQAWKGDWNAAIAAFDQAIAIAPRSSGAYLNRGLAYQAQGDEERALADLDKAIRYAPYAARGYYHRSLLQRQRGETRKADADRDRASQLDSRYEP